MKENRTIAVINGYEVKESATSSWGHKIYKTEPVTPITEPQIFILRAIVYRFKIMIRMPRFKWQACDVLAELHDGILNNKYAHREVGENCESGKAVVTTDGWMVWIREGSRDFKQDIVIDYIRTEDNDDYKKYMPTINKHRYVDDLKEDRATCEYRNYLLGVGLRTVRDYTVKITYDKDLKAFEKRLNAAEDKIENGEIKARFEEGYAVLFNNEKIIFVKSNNSNNTLTLAPEVKTPIEVAPVKTSAKTTLEELCEENQIEYVATIMPLGGNKKRKYELIMDENYQVTLINKGEKNTEFDGNDRGFEHVDSTDVFEKTNEIISYIVEMYGYMYKIVLAPVFASIANELADYWTCEVIVKQKQQVSQVAQKEKAMVHDIHIAKDFKVTLTFIEEDFQDIDILDPVKEGIEFYDSMTDNLITVMEYAATICRVGKITADACFKSCEKELTNQGYHVTFINAEVKKESNNAKEVLIKAPEVISGTTKIMKMSFEAKEFFTFELPVRTNIVEAYKSAIKYALDKHDLKHIYVTVKASDFVKELEIFNIPVSVLPIYESKYKYFKL